MASAFHPPSDLSSSSPLLRELKTRARLQRNASRGALPVGDAFENNTKDLRLRDCLNQVARSAGFAHWEHARRVLGGWAEPADDMGTFWYAPGCEGLLNRWFASYPQAQAALASHARAILLPYRRQFVLANKDFLRELNVDADHPAWALTGRDLVQAYGSTGWVTLASLRLGAPRHTFAPQRASLSGRSQ